jgi:hypothetical protein
MPLSTDTTTNFTSSTGYTLFNGANITFSSGTAKLSSAYEGSGAIRTPQIDSSAWAPAINGIGVTQTEAVGYKHRFAFSFDDWTGTGRKSYKRFTNAGWETIATDETSEADLLTIIIANGMSKRDAEKIREWPAQCQQVSVLVGMQRETGGGDGTIDLITWSYGTETETVDTEGTASGTLPFEPEWPLRCRFIDPVQIVQMGQYQQVVRLGTALRRAYSLTFPPQSTTDKATLLTFLRSHVATPFNWTAFPESTERAWTVIGTPTERKLAAGVYRVTCEIEESL